MEKTQSVLKRKLSFDEMIHHLESKSIKFNIVSQTKAKQILMNSNYFYKITSYRKNFIKNGEDRYIDLEFSYLSDLATIDMRLRYLVLQMSLDIEHRIKTKILSDITNNSNDDGYAIVSAFLKFDKSSVDRYFKGLKRESHYNYGIYSKHGDNPPIWVLFEIMSFGNFVKFVEFYYIYVGRPSEYSDLYKVLKYVKNVRNSAAHNSPLIMDIVKINQLTQPTVRPISTFVKGIPGISKEIQRKKLSNRKVHDLTALLYVYDTFIDSAPMKEVRYNDLTELLERCLRNKDHYIKHNGLVSVYQYFFKIIDFLKGRA